MTREEKLRVVNGSKRGQTARITASTSNPANSNSPASRLEWKIRWHSSGSLMSEPTDLPDQMRGERGSPIQNGHPAPASASRRRRSKPPPAHKYRQRRMGRAPNRSAVDLIPISASSSVS